MEHIYATLYSQYLHVSTVLFGMEDTVTKV